MKKIEAYQTSDSKKFFKEKEAQKHEDGLGYKANIEKIQNYLFALLKIEKLGNDEDGEDQEEQLSNMLMDEGVSGLWDDAIELDLVIELIIDVVTILDGALLKTAQYAKKITSQKKKETKG